METSWFVIGGALATMVIHGVTLAGRVSKSVRQPIEKALENKTTEFNREIMALQREITHNRANTDTKHQAADMRLNDHAGKIGSLERADVEHTAAIRHLEKTMSSGFDNLKETFKERFGEVLTELRTRGNH